MITNEDLTAAIAECEGVRNPNANTCIKLAALYTIRSNRQGTTEPKTHEAGYSYAATPAQRKNTYESSTEFGQMIRNKNASNVLEVFDELMNALQKIVPRLYNGVIAKLQEID